MRIENLLRVRDAGRLLGHVVADGDSGRRLYCDGTIIVACPDLELRGRSTSHHTKMSVSSHNLWKSVEADPPAHTLSDGGLFGSFTTHYARKLTHPEVSRFIDERFIRCFAPGAEFKSDTRKNHVAVFEGGMMVAILMPMDLNDEEPPVPFLEDDVLYHECPDEDD